MKKNIVFWPYKWDHVRDNLWGQKAQWLVSAFSKLGYDSYCHPDMQIPDCEGLTKLEDPFSPEMNHPNVKAVLYTHATAGDFTTPEIRRLGLFYKGGAGPDIFRGTLDSLGFGSYSTVTYTKPNFEEVSSEEVTDFFNTTVKEWIEDKTTKWGKDMFTEQLQELPSEYALVLCQIPDDEVVTNQDFGGYVDKLVQVIEQLHLTATDPIVVKLHPLMEPSVTEIKRPKRFEADRSVDWSLRISLRLKDISEDITVITEKCSVHDVLPNAKYVVLGNSGTGYEAMMHRKPIISFAQPEFHWVTYDLRKLCDMWRAIDTDQWFDAEMSDKFLYWFMVKHCIYDEASTLRRVKELLDERPSIFEEMIPSL